MFAKSQRLYWRPSRGRIVVGVCCVVLTCLALPGQAQVTVLHQEGFNDDGDGVRYFMEGRGQEVGAAGPGMWEHNFNVDVIGLPATAPAKRAAILWANELLDIDFTDESLAIWDNLIDWALDGKENATIGWIPDINSNTPDFLSLRLEDKGYSTLEYGGGPLWDASEVDLVIHTDGAAIDPPTAFVSYAVPVITYNAPNHDDTLISTIGTATAPGGPIEVTIVAANQDHPILGGLTGTIPWTSEFGADIPLQGIGAGVPAGSKTLATYIDPATGLELPALLVVEAGDPMLGAFAPLPEGVGYIVGGDLNEAYGGGGSVDMPRAVQLIPVDVSGQENVQLTVGLAATAVDFEPDDFMRVLISKDGGDEFETLANFVGLNDAASPNNKALVDAVLGPLNPNEFTDFTFDIPADATELIVRIEAYNTFPNEVVGIDNIRITAGVGSPNDLNGDGVVDVNDLGLVGPGDIGTRDAILTEAGLLAGDLDGVGGVAFPDFLTLSNNFGKEGNYLQGDIDVNGSIAFPDFLTLSNNFGKSAAAAAAVPEPSCLALLGLASLLTGLVRRRRA